MSYFRKFSDYKITAQTMAIFPFVEKDTIISRILEVNRELFVSLTPQELLNSGCLFYGSSYSGRKEASKYIAAIQYKVPIIMDSSKGMYFFPTTSPSKEECIWISEPHVLTQEKQSRLGTLVTFVNGINEVVPVSLSSFKKQVEKTVYLRSKYEQNMKMLNDTTNKLVSEPVWLYEFSTHSSNKDRMIKKK
ncbi:MULTISPECIES: competence protein ComK [Bacillus]|uniref:competence protein ComK n=1 Tax=Bacillus TaxID=1386 RepID=UPI000BB7F944|nr:MULTISPECIES: competence protein ComK [Bacillus]